MWSFGYCLWLLQQIHSCTVHTRRERHWQSMRAIEQSSEKRVKEICTAESLCAPHTRAISIKLLARRTYTNFQTTYTQNRCSRQEFRKEHVEAAKYMYTTCTTNDIRLCVSMLCVSASPLPPTHTHAHSLLWYKNYTQRKWFWMEA